MFRFRSLALLFLFGLLLGFAAPVLATASSPSPRTSPTPSGTSTADTKNYGCPTPFTPASWSLFPFIDPASTELATDANGDGRYCSPTYWHIGIVQFYLQKLSAIVAYITGSATILLLMWGGVIYIRAGSTAKPEEEGKKARAIITGAIVGLIIVVFSGFIVGGAFFIFGDSSQFDQAVSEMS
jgi:hypothetical protein